MGGKAEEGILGPVQGFSQIRVRDSGKRSRFTRQLGLPHWGSVGCQALGRECRSCTMIRLLAGFEEPHVSLTDCKLVCSKYVISFL